jgi:hypothetical protein
MQALGILLVLINVVTIAGPVVGVAIVYQNNLTELVIPPELTQLLNSTVVLGNQATLAQVLNVQIDNNSRTLTLTVGFTNPLNYTLTLNSFDATLECSQHHYFFGNLNLVSPVALPAALTTEVNLVCLWSTEAEAHVRAAHPGATNIDLNLLGLIINVNDINVALSNPVGVPNVPIA